MSGEPIHSENNRDAAFARIKTYFDEYDRSLARTGKLPLGSTEKGFWGTSHLDDVYEFCKRAFLEKETAFADLGSGDGRVVFVVALFTRAIGIEYDEKLHALALKAQETLQIPRASFVCGDYTEINLAEYPVWFMYADHNFSWLEEKQEELHTLYLYHDTFHPHFSFVEKGKIMWIAQIPIFKYTRVVLDSTSPE